MAEPVLRDPRQFRRRDALRLLAATGTGVGTSLIVSQPAFADSGSTACRYDFGGAPQMAVGIRNRGGNQSDTLSLTVSGVGGTCPCGGGATIEYSYFVSIPGIGQGGTGWTSSSTVSVTNPAVLWPNAGGSVTVAVGIRVTCAAVVGDAIRCRYGSATYTVGPANYTATEILPLPNNNGNSPPPSGLPACDPPALQRSAFQVFSGGSGGMIGFVPGLLPEPIDEPLTDPITDLGPVEPVPPVDPPAESTTSSSTTTSPPTTTAAPPPTTAAPPTTTEVPGPAPQPTTTTTTSPPTTSPPVSQP